jgi:hypothetical protein
MGTVIGNAIGVPFGGAQSWNSYWATLIPMPLVAYGTGETTIQLSVTDVFSGAAKLAWYVSSDLINYTKFATTAKGVLTTTATGLTAGTLYDFKVRAEQGANYSAWSNIASIPTWVTQMTTYNTAIAGTKPSAQIASAINLFYWRMLGNNSSSRNSYTKFDCQILLASGTVSATDALLWLNNPARTGALHGTSNPSYVAGQGFTGNIAQSSYIDTTFNPTTDGVNYTQNANSNLHFFYNNRLSNSETSVNGLYKASNNFGIAPRYDVSNLYYAAQTTSYKNKSHGGLGTNTLFSAVRTSSSIMRLYRNKVSLGDDSVASAALYNASTYILAANNGSAATAFSSDTIGYVAYGGTLDATDISVINDALGEFYNGIQSSTPALNYTADGTSLDAAKWTVTNPNPTYVAFAQDDALTMETTTLGSANTFTNNIQSVDSRLFGVWKFSLLDIEKVSTSGVRSVGLYADGNNRIEIYRNTTHTLSFRIVYLNGTVYDVDTGIVDFGQFKIIVTATHNISLWVWSNDAWLQIGVTQSYQLGLKTLCLAASGYDGSMTKMRDIIITAKDFSTLNPV